MPFSAATCLTYTGTTTLGNTIEVYVDSDSYGSLFTTVSLTDITTNCPYYFLNVPDGTNNIKLLDPVSCCYCIIPIQSNNLCVTCDLNFNYYSPVTVGNIVAGDLTGSCDPSITDYLIFWYETGDTVNAVFSSGKGTSFQPYDYVHPLTGTSSVLSPSGTYEAILEKVEINGVTFSRTGGTGTVLAQLDCLPSVFNSNPIVVDALRCDNGGGSSDLPQYEHKFAYSATTGGLPPSPLNTTFELSANSKYFVWKFKGFDVPDKIKLTFVGSSYPDPILLEYWEVGSNLTSSNINPSTFPKSADTIDYFGKVTCLTGLTVNLGDNILIEVIPSTTNNKTSWTFYCGCLDNFDCSICQPPSATTVSGTTSYQYPIIGSSITGVTGTCDTINISFNLSGCPANSFTNSDFYKFAGLITSTPNTGVFNRTITNLSLSNIKCVSVGLSCGNYSCLNNGSNITYTKTPGLFRVTSDSLSTINTFYSTYLTCMVPNISPFSGDNTNIGYYRYMRLVYPSSTGSTLCGDGTPARSLNIHQSSVVTTGITGSDYYIEYTMPTITNGTSFGTCDAFCTSNTNSYVNTVNIYSTGATYDYTGTTTVGSLYDKPTYIMSIINLNNTPNTQSTVFSYFGLGFYLNDTYPATGNTSYTLVPSYSAKTCDDMLTNFTFNSASFRYEKYYYYYTAVLFDPLDFKNFRILANEINLAGNVSNTIKTIVYEYSGGTVTYSNPEYII